MSANPTAGWVRRLAGAPASASLGRCVRGLLFVAGAGRGRRGSRGTAAELRPRLRRRRSGGQRVAHARGCAGLGCGGCRAGRSVQLDLQHACRKHRLTLQNACNRASVYDLAWRTLHSNGT